MLYVLAHRLPYRKNERPAKRSVVGEGLPAENQCGNEKHRRLEMKSQWAKIAAMMLVIGFLATSLAIAGEESITGVVEQTEQGIVISADDGASYLVQGQNLSAMVGKTLKATGTLSEGENGKVITVTHIEEISE